MAEELYFEMVDMDFMDYAEDYERDIAFIGALVEAIGKDDARAVLRDMREG